VSTGHNYICEPEQYLYPPSALGDAGSNVQLTGSENAVGSIAPYWYVQCNDTAAISALQGVSEQDLQVNPSIFKADDAWIIADIVTGSAGALTRAAES
jgi:hypothetical protein